MASSTIEFTDLGGHRISNGEAVLHNHSSPAEDASQSLPPVDGGKQAWGFLAGCFLLDGIVWGFPLSYGVFQKYYTRELFAQTTDDNSGIAAIGSTCTGVAYILSPLVAVTMQRFPHIRRPAMFFGLVIAVTSMIAGSFCNTVGGLLATQGVFYGLGCILLYFPGNLFLDEWFVKRKALAYGISWSGTGTAGVIVPFVMQWLLDTYGFRSALRIWAGVLFILSLPVLWLVRPRLPASNASALRARDLSFMKHFPFWLYQFGNIAQALGCFLPLLWMPTFAASIGLPQYAGPLSVAMYNGGVSVGSVVLGTITDRYHVTVSILVCTTGSVVGAFIFWGLTNSAPMLFIFAVIWGFFTGGFNATWAGCAADMRRTEQNNNVDTGIVISLMAAGKGVGSVVGGPLSASLLDMGWHVQSKFAYGTHYGILVVFCGVSAAFGGAACVDKAVKIIRSMLSRDLLS